MQFIADFRFLDLKKNIQDAGFPSYTAGQLMNWVYQKRVRDVVKMTNLSKPVKAYVKDTFDLSIPLELVQKLESIDGTVKFLFKLHDKAHIESVLLHDKDRVTVCISTQAGCARGCVFCASTKKGLIRNLTAAEIIGQYLFIDDFVRAGGKEQVVTNLVFMGMGEPLENLQEVSKAIELLTASYAVGLSKRRICVSTCGVVPQIYAFADMHPGAKLSVSLNAITDEKRDTIMPINKKYPLKELLPACKNYANKSKFPVTFEYILFSGFNMAKEDVNLLAKKLHGIDAKINFIPYNPLEKDLCLLKEPSTEEIAEFLGSMKQKHLFYSLRQSKGRDIRAACGNLAFRLSEATA